MKLSELETCMIRSFMEVDEDDNVYFKQAARMIGELIKRFFSPKMMQLKERFDEQRLVQPNEKMMGWTDEEIATDMADTFRRFDTDMNNSIDFDEFRRCIKKICFWRITD